MDWSLRIAHSLSMFVIFKVGTLPTLHSPILRWLAVVHSLPLLATPSYPSFQSRRCFDLHA